MAANGSSADSAAPNGLSAAEVLRQKHEAEEAHRATIEDVVDEEDVVHPPPSSLPPPQSAPSAPIPPVVETMSAKAAGKQPARDEPPKEAPPASANAPKAALDTQSHDLFPSLGAGPQASPSRPMAAAWGAKKPAAVSNAPQKVAPNGYGPNGTNAAAGSPTSRTSTPASSGLATPNTSSAAPSTAGHTAAQRGPLPQSMSIPGKYTERITLFPQEMKPRSQLKKPVPDILREINRRSKAIVQMSSGAGEAYHFDAKGPVDAVRQALKDVAKELGSKQSTKVTVPASIRPHIIGRQGAIVQGISQRTGARIQVPRPDEASNPADEEDDEVIDVLIEGDSVAAEMARREIEGIVNERTSTVNMRLREIPAEFYPFIAGPHQSLVSDLEDGRELRVQIPQYYTWSSQAPPPLPQPNEQPIFSPAKGTHIQLSGDRLAVQEARAKIEQQVEALRRQLTLSQIDINKGQHQFVVGDRGNAVHDILAETGCAVLLPPSGHESETLTIVGPADKIEAGMDKVMDLATSMQMTLVDISRQHPKAPLGAAAHARNLTRYLKHRREIERLERLYDAHIALPSLGDGPVSWEVYSRDGKNNIRARTEIMNMVNGLPPSRIAPLDVDTFYHQHLHDRSAEKLSNDYGVRLLLPEEGLESPELLLVYEGPSAGSPDFQLPRQAPASAQVAEFEKALEDARDHLLSLIVGKEDINARSVEIPKKFHEKARRFVVKEQANLPAGEAAVHVQIGEPRSAAGQRARPQNPIAAAALENEVSLRGPASSVDALAAKLTAFVQEESELERERGYTTTFDYPQKFANHLIGKKGENIRKIRDEFDVEVQVNDGKVEIKGPKVKAEAAKASIITLGKKLQDETTHVLKVKPQYHRDLIGGKGSQVNRLQERYNVRVNFPRSVSAVPSSDDQSLADTVSESGGGRSNGRPQQAPDEVIIRGARKGADEARDELLGLLQWTIDNSHSATVSVAQSQVPSLIGQGGREMDNLRMSTGAQIDVPDLKRDGADPTSRVDIKIKGTKKQVESAKSLLQERAKVFDDRVTRTVDVDKKHHRALIGGGGSNIRDIVIKAGGPDDRRELARMVRFPRQDSDESQIRVEGSKAVVDKIVASIEEIIGQRENQVTVKVDVDPSQHRLLIGRNGETRRNLESQFHVSVDVPKQATSGQQTDPGVTLVGQPADVEQAKTHILSLVKDKQGETIQVPRKVHHAVSDNGQFFRRLRNEHKVLIDHAGHRPPPKPAASSNTRERVNGGALPLITDEADSSSTAENFSWEILDDDSHASQEEGEIPWILRGPADNVAQARALVHAAIERAQAQSSTGYLILPDPKTYRYVIGPGGSQVNAIRQQTGCRITVPRDQARGEAIELQGGRAGVEEAKAMILEVLRNGSGGGGAGGRRDSHSA